LIATAQAIRAGMQYLVRERGLRRAVKPRLLALLFIVFSLNGASAQSSIQQVRPILADRVQPSAVVEFDLRHYLMQRIPKLPAPISAEQWTSQRAQFRRHLLNDIVFHGWPREWVDAPPRFEDLGVIGSSSGYRMRKLRYEIVPGFWSSAVLYEPASLTGKVAAILSVNGHVGPEGKAIEYKQKRCINYAKQGILTLSLEWFGFGELSQPENGHDFAAHLEFVGASAIGLFYLAMRRGLDYLYNHPSVDRNKLGMTGLSGGGWQTIVLSALDERISVAVPVAGYGSLMSNIIHPADTSEIEEDATDFREGQDYTTLTAMRAPQPTLLIYNAEDDCCFRAPFVKQDIYDDIKPFFRLYGKEDALEWHENLEPGTHNYQVDNRQQSYRFFTKYFDLPIVEREIPVDAEIRSYDELVVGLPKDNLTVLGLARKLAQEIKRQPIPSDNRDRRPWAQSEREKLKTVVRYQQISLRGAWKMSNTKNKGVESVSYRFEFSNQLSATAVWIKAITSADDAPVTIVLNDKGKKAAAAEVSSRVNRGEQVLAVDLLFTGDAAPEQPGPADYALIVAATGNRPIGLEAAQLITLARWLGETSRKPQVRLETTGMRSQVTALVASSIEPTLFSEVVISKGITSLAYLLDTPVGYRTSPDLFCLDFYKEFDLESLVLLAEPTKVTYPNRESSSLQADKE
jgi:dienelactone hydrolase